MKKIICLLNCVLITLTLFGMRQITLGDNLQIKQADFNPKKEMSFCKFMPDLDKICVSEEGLDKSGKHLVAKKNSPDIKGLEGNWIFFFGDYYFNNSKQEIITREYFAELDGNEILFVDLAGEGMPFIGIYDSETGIIRFEKTYLGQGGSMYVFQNPFYYNSEGKLISSDITASYNERNGGEISMDQNNFGISWEAYFDYESTSLAGYYDILDIYGATRSGKVPDSIIDEREEGQWISVGIATFIDSWILPGYKVDGIMVNPNEYPYEVELQQNLLNRNIYRLWQPYANSILNTPEINQSFYLGQIIFDVSDPQHVEVMASGKPCGFKNLNGEFYLFNELGHYIRQGYDRQYVIDTLYGDNPSDTFDNGVVTINNPIFNFSPNGHSYYYYTDNSYPSIIIFPGSWKHTLTLNFPDNVNLREYENMNLVLYNDTTSQRISYVINDQTSYSFRNIPDKTIWNARIENNRGDVFGEIKNIEVKDDLNITFSQLIKPLELTLKVFTPDNTDVTNLVKVSWTDSKGIELGENHVINGLLPGTKLNCVIKLPENLMMEYVLPQLTEFEVKDNNSAIIVNLKAIPQIELTGYIKDSSTLLGIKNADISAVQVFGDKCTKTVKAKTDSQGKYKMTLSNVETSFTGSAVDYVSRSLNINPLQTPVDHIDIPDIFLNPIMGPVLNLDFTFTPSVSSGDNVQVQDWYKDYNNISYRIFDKTQNKEITLYNLQYPKIVLLENIEEGDVIEVTASSKTNAFMPVSVVATIGSDFSADLKFGIIELGKIIASFRSNDNKEVLGSLYDSNGKLVKSYRYNNSSITFGDLTDGEYNLVSMGNSSLYATVYELRQLSETGLVSGIDYVQSSIRVKSGQISVLTIDEIPLLDESKLYFTGSNTSFAVNKSNIVTGNYLTFTTYLDFKPEFEKDVENISLIFDIPEESSFVPNSVMAGNTVSGFSIERNRLVIPINNLDERVVFCIVPTIGGQYSPTAFVKFDLNGQTKIQPIGSAYYNAKSLSISVPALTSNTSIVVNGNSAGSSDIDIYDNDVLIAQTKSLGNGTYSVNCDLHESYNLSAHNIYAKMHTWEGLDLISETKQCIYNNRAIEAKTVTMSFYNGWLNRNVEVIFNLQNKSVSESSYMFSAKTDMTFIADLTDNDPEIVKDVVIRVYTDKGNWHNLKAEYDYSNDKWIAVSSFSSDELPVGVKVKFLADIQTEIDAEVFSRGITQASTLIEDMKLSQDENEDCLSSITEALNQDNIDYALIEDLLNEYGIEYSYDKKDNINESEILADIDSVDQLIEEIGITSFNTISSLNQFSEELNQYLEGVEFVSCEGLNENQLINLGYNKVNKTDGGVIYILCTEEQYEIVDFASGTRVIYSVESELYSLSLYASRDDFITRFNNACENIGNLLNRLLSTVNLFVDAIDNVKEVLNNNNLKLTKKIGELMDDAIYLNQTGGSKLLIANIDIKLQAAITAKNVNKKIIDWLTENTKQFTTSKGLGKAVGIFSLIMDLRDAVSDLSQVITLYNKCMPCPDDEAEALRIQESLRNIGMGATAFYIAQISMDIASMTGAMTSLIAAIPTAGSSLVAAGVSIGVLMANFIVCEAYSHSFENNMNIQENRIENLKCKHNDDDDDNNNNDDDPPCPTINPIHDPSGYVYEGVPSNRLKGVKATAFYKEEVEDMYGEVHENIVKWDAAEYAQENPLFTDEFGTYRWDVPQGLWQVKFEKDGYETTYSDWLPVPPPQLDVNIAMKQNIQPKVKVARAYERAVEFEFDKYMKSESLIKENISVMTEGAFLEGEIELLDMEEELGANAGKYASKVSFIPSSPIHTKEVTLIVNNKVTSYAGIPMQDEYSRTLSVEQEIKEIKCDSEISVNYGYGILLTVKVLPESASEGKILKVKSSSSMILSTDVSEMTVDSKGEAKIFIMGEMPGRAALTFLLDGYDLSATILVNVTSKQDNKVLKPQANIESGSIVDVGTEIYLSCLTEAAVIYYTLDGSCPCDADRLLYDGTPIIISDDVTVKAMAQAYGMEDSDIVEFKYFVKKSEGVVDVSLAKNIVIYPIPMHDRLNVTAGGKMIEDVTIIGLTGTVVAKSAKPACHVVVNVESLENGIYVVNVTTSSGLFSYKVVKK